MILIWLTHQSQCLEQCNFRCRVVTSIHMAKWVWWRLLSFSSNAPACLQCLTWNRRSLFIIMSRMSYQTLHTNSRSAYDDLLVCCIVLLHGKLIDSLFRVVWQLAEQLLSWIIELTALPWTSQMMLKFLVFFANSVVWWPFQHACPCSQLWNQIAGHHCVIQCDKVWHQHVSHFVCIYYSKTLTGKFRRARAGNNTFWYWDWHACSCNLLPFTMICLLDMHSLDFLNLIHTVLDENIGTLAHL